jgi:hypothetical protein
MNINNSYIDIAGTINDFGLLLQQQQIDHNSNVDDLSEKQFKRALLMVNRSYCIDIHLKATLLSNLINCYNNKNDNKNELFYLEQLELLLKKYSKSLQLLGREFINNNELNNNKNNNYLWSNNILPKIRKSQFYFIIGKSICELRSYQEGIIIINFTFQFLVNFFHILVIYIISFFYLIWDC